MKNQVTSMFEELLVQKALTLVQEVKKQVASDILESSFSGVLDDNHGVTGGKYSPESIAASKKAWKATNKARSTDGGNNKAAHLAAEKAHRMAFAAHRPGGEAARGHAEQAGIHKYLATGIK